MQVEVKVELVNMFDIWIISRTQEFVSSGVLSQSTWQHAVSRGNPAPTTGWGSLL